MPTEQELQNIEDKAARAAELEALQPITLDEYETAVKKWLLLEDPYILRLIVYHYVANSLDGDPVWLMINGASGGGKSELLYMLFDLEKSVPISTLTTNTLVSGYPGKTDVSLLPKLNGKIVILKDFTTIISMQKDARMEIISQLREIYDGRYVKAFGTGKTIDWEGKVGMIAATTEHFDMFAMHNASMGERFIQYRLVTGDREKTAERAINNTADVKQMRREMRNAMYALMKGIDCSQPVTPLAPDTVSRLIKLANFATLARSSVIRDMGMKKEVIFVPSPEMPTRLAQQLVRFVQAATLVGKGECPTQDLAAVYKIALDSIPKRDRQIMQQLTAKNNQTTAEIATRINYPSNTVHHVLEDLTIKELCIRVRGVDSDEGGNADRWTLKDDFREILSFYDKIKKEEDIIEELTPIAESFGGTIEM